MNPSADPPAAFEPQNHVAPVTGTAPSYGVNDLNNHPAYPEMITSAIMALNETKGSSRQAIAKYMEQSYSNLPPNHATLLTHNLKRMKNSGHLFMFKHSYLLSRSVPLPVDTLPPSPQPAPPLLLPPPSPNPAVSMSVTPASTATKRGPGRPPKAKPETPINFNSTPVSKPQPVVAPVEIGHEPISVFASESPVVAETAMGPESMFVSLGLSDAPPTSETKRGRGRPPKPKFDGSVASAVPVPVPPTTTTVISSSSTGTGLSSRGRRHKPKFSSSLTIGQAAGGVLKKKGRGRPPRSGPVLAVGLGLRGRPMKSGRPRGRPAKVAGGAVSITTAAIDGPVALPIDGVDGGVLVAKRGRGRLPTVGGGVKKPRKLSGKPRGRPRKNATNNAVDVAIQQHQQLAATEDLRIKLEHVQSRIKVAVGVVKPYLNSGNAVGALGAIEELEQLAAMDASMEWFVPEQHNPPPPQNPAPPLNHVPEPAQNPNATHLQEPGMTVGGGY